MPSNNTAGIPALQGAKLTGKNGHVYRFQVLLGRGEFGVVYRCVDERTSTAYACKVLNQSALTNCLENVGREVDIMTQVQHERVLGLHEFLVAGSLLFLFMRFVPGGSLAERLALGPLDVGAAGHVVREILEGVAYLHAHHICHRDLKPANILCTSADVRAVPDVVIADFGLSRTFGRDELMKTHCGSSLYAAPEVFQRTYTEACDMWSLGVITVEMLRGRDALLDFAGPGTGICTGTGTGTGADRLGGAFPPLVRDFVAKLLQDDPAQRLTAAAALEHPWMREVAQQNNTPSPCPSPVATPPLSHPDSTSN